VTATTVTPELIRAALNDVQDPCSVVAGAPGGLDEFGLVRAVEVIPGPGGAHVRVTVGVTEQTCLMAPIFVRDARERLARVPGVASVDVTLDPTLVWTEADLSPAYRERLEGARASRRETRRR